MAQGHVLVGGYEAKGMGARQIASTSAVGRIPNDAIMERELPMQSILSEIHLYLDSPSLALAKLIEL